MSSNCHSRESCKLCAEEHSVAKCTNKDKPAKCSNCKGNHEADDTNCPTYIKQIRTVHEARGIPKPVKMDERKLTFLQINFCGLSEHSKIALNHSVHQKNPDVVFLNETKANLPRHFLNNYNAISEHNHGLEGEAILLREEIPYARLSEIEENSVDNIALTILSNGLKLVVQTAYVQPENSDGVKNKMKVLENCKKFVDDSKINGCIFFADLNARHQNWGDTKSNRL